MRESDHRRLLAQLAQRKHAESALWALVSLPRMEPVEYLLSVLADVHYVAHHGVTRRDPGASFDVAGKTKRNISGDEIIGGRSYGLSASLSPHFESQPPKHDPRAQAELRWLLQRIDKLATEALGRLDEIAGESVE